MGPRIHLADLQGLRGGLTLVVWSSGRSSTAGTPNVARLLGDAVDVYLGEREAQEALAGVLTDEPE
jgi:hypothetical protein